MSDPYVDGIIDAARDVVKIVNSTGGAEGGRLWFKKIAALMDAVEAADTKPLPPTSPRADERHPTIDEQRGFDSALRRSSELVAETAKALVRRMEDVYEHPAFKSVWTVNQMHVGPYTGPKWEDEFNALKRALHLSSALSAPLDGEDEAVAAVNKAMAGVNLRFPSSAGMVLVPEEPTEEMLTAGNPHTNCGGACGNKGARDTYRAMIAARPAVLAGREKG